MRKILICIMLGLSTCYAMDIKAIKTNEQFEEVARIDKLEQIKISTPPTTQYTPKNLKKQQIVSFQGRDNSNTMVYWSSTFTDYDTKITKSELMDEGYFITDNTGKQFKTGDNLTPIQNSINQIVNDMSDMNNNINTNTQNIQNNTIEINKNRTNVGTNRQDIQRINTTLNQYKNSVSELNERVDKVESDLYAGLATVAALTSLHPNPRNNSPVELSIGGGVYRDQCAGAAGVFVHPTDNIMIQGGFAFGNRNNYAGFTGITIGLPWFKK